MKTILLTLILLTTINADIKECNFRIKMGDNTNKAALKLYENGNYTDALHKFKMARSNYIMGFSHCRGTNREDELINKSEATSNIINNRGLNTYSKIQKLLND